MVDAFKIYKCLNKKVLITTVDGSKIQCILKSFKNDELLLNEVEISTIPPEYYEEYLLELSEVKEVLIEDENSHDNQINDVIGSFPKKIYVPNPEVVVQQSSIDLLNEDEDAISILPGKPYKILLNGSNEIIFIPKHQNECLKDVLLDDISTSKRIGLQLFGSNISRHGHIEIIAIHTQACLYAVEVTQQSLDILKPYLESDAIEKVMLDCRFAADALFPHKITLSQVSDIAAFERAVQRKEYHDAKDRGRPYVKLPNNKMATLDDLLKKYQLLKKEDFKIKTHKKYIIKGDLQMSAKNEIFINTVFLCNIYQNQLFSLLREGIMFSKAWSDSSSGSCMPANNSPFDEDILNSYLFEGTFEEKLRSATFQTLRLDEYSKPQTNKIIKTCNGLANGNEIFNKKTNSHYTESSATLSSLESKDSNCISHASSSSSLTFLTARSEVQFDSDEDIWPTIEGTRFNLKPAGYNTPSCQSLRRPFSKSLKY